jgi:DNA modification methylase
MGSGTTNFVAQRMSRNSIGIEISSEYYNMVKTELDKQEKTLFTQLELYG